MVMLRDIPRAYRRRRSKSCRMFFTTVVVIALGIPIIRAFTRRFERGPAPPQRPPPDVIARLRAHRTGGRGGRDRSRAHRRSPALLREAAGRTGAARAAATGRRARVALRMPSVLIIDDEPNIRRMVGALLSAEGYEVRDAPDGATGLARAIEAEPDVVLLDLMMPGELDGLATLARMRESRARRSGRHDERTRRTERRGEGDEARRIQLSRKAAEPRGRAARAVVGARAARRRGARRRRCAPISA